MALCPEVFEADEFGYAVVKHPDVRGDLVEKARLAERNCPENAISVT